MKLSSSFVVLSALVSSALVSALPLESRKSSNETKVMNESSSGAKGAVYFITNQPQENFVVSADIGSDGKLTLARAVGTQGSGLHGNDGKNGPDGLFSQGSVKASAVSSLLATVNPGSNTLSLFQINPETPSDVKMVGFPVGSEGEFPMSLAFNGNGTTLCALNGGAVNGVACFKTNGSSGLVGIANTVRPLGLNQTTPPAGPANTASHIIFSEDGKNLIASVKGTPPNDPGFLAVWDVADDGSLSQDFKKVSPAQGGLLPFSMTVIPGKNAILATDAGIGVDIFDMSSGNSSRNSILPIANQSATCWSAFSKQTGNFYVTDIGTSKVTEVHVDDNLKPSIVKQYQQQENAATIDLDVASIGGKDFAYILMPIATAIQVKSLNAPGQATDLQTLDIAGPAARARLPVDKANLQGMTAFVKA
ncbi:hypothetical protein BC834DRAFT_924642 [Gloeopeniophorella convolvens]|nr:hypothetical protein BC834DRAFT_924642 [Gloeopeniophorella convolvens]